MLGNQFLSTVTQAFGSSWWSESLLCDLSPLTPSSPHSTPPPAHLLQPWPPAALTDIKLIPTGHMWWPFLPALLTQVEVRPPSRRLLSSLPTHPCVWFLRGLASLCQMHCTLHICVSDCSPEYDFQEGNTLASVPRLPHNSKGPM